MGKIAELFERIKAAGVAFVAPAPQVVLQQPNASLLKQRINEAQAVLDMMQTEGWKVYFGSLKVLKARRVDELLNLPASAGDAARCLQQGLTKGIDEASEAATVIVRVGEASEDILNELVRRNDANDVSRKANLVRRV